MGIEDQKALRSLWSGIDGDICIIYPALNSARWTIELKNLFKDHLDGSPIVSPQLRETMGTEELASWISRFGPHITSGDIYACMHVIMLLSVFYGADKLKLHEAFYLKGLPPELLKQELKNNLVLIGGPSGNPITNQILNDTKLNNLFTNAPNNDFNIVMPDGKIFQPNPIPNDCHADRNIEDIGVFLKIENPYNPGKFIFAAMGSNSWGTQGAASLACSPKGAKNIKNIQFDGKIPDFNLPKIVHTLACIKVFKEHNTNIVKIDDNREIKLQLIWPAAGDEIISNPKGISQAISYQLNELREAAAFEMQNVLSFGWGRAVFTVLFFIVTAVLLCLTIQKSIPLQYAIPLCLVSFYFGFYHFVRLPYTRKYKE